MKILVVAPSWVGDMTMAQSMFKSCLDKTPDALIDVVAPEWSLPLLSRMPEVHKTIPLPLGHGQLKLFKRLSIGRSLAVRSYDWAIVIPRTWKSALIPFLARVPRRTGYVGEMRFGLINDLRALDRKKLDKTILRQLALAEEKSTPLPPPIRHYPRLSIDQGNQERLMRNLKLNLDRPAVCFCPGAEYGPAKQWPIDYFKQLAELLVAKGYQIWTLGSSKETRLGEAAHPGSEAWYKNLCGRTKLEDTVDLMALASHVVSNDSGLMHVAAAVGVKLEAIFGSSSPDYTPPLSERATIHCLGLSCSPCFKRSCPHDHLSCLLDITPDRILKSIHTSRH